MSQPKSSDMLVWDETGSKDKLYFLKSMRNMFLIVFVGIKSISIILIPAWKTSFSKTWIWTAVGVTEAVTVLDTAATLARRAVSLAPTVSKKIFWRQIKRTILKLWFAIFKLTSKFAAKTLHSDTSSRSRQPGYASENGAVPVRAALILKHSFSLSPSQVNNMLISYLNTSWEAKEEAARELNWTQK